MKVKLDEVINAIEAAGDEVDYFYDTRSDEIIYYVDELLTGVDNTELKEDLEENYDKYIHVPGQYERHDYNIMRSFVLNFADDDIREQLEQAISGTGAFRVFKYTIYNLGVEKDWYDFQKNAYTKIAIEWCQRNNIEYT